MSAPPSGGTLRSLVGNAAAMAKAGGPAVVGQILSIPLDQIDDNPFQHRTEMDPERLEELANDIERRGLLQPITVRRHGDRWQTIAGHRRRAAYAELLTRAKSDPERERWSRIPAQEKVSVDDEEMRASGLSENLHRDDPSALDAASGLAEYQAAFSLTAQQLAERMALPVARVKRLLRLATAPEVVKKGVTRGLMIPLLDENKQPVLTRSGKPRHEHRHLDLLAALEFAKLHARYAVETPKKANDRVERAIERALQENWGFRRIESFVKAALAGKPGAGDADRAAASAGAPLFKETKSQLTVYLARVGEAAPEDLAALRARLAEILAALPCPPAE